MWYISMYSQSPFFIEGVSMDRIIFFTKAPRPGFGKSRLKPYLNEEQRFELMKLLINDNYSEIKETNKEFVVYYDGKKDDIDFIGGKKLLQFGDGLGRRMRNAIFQELETADKVVLMGSDIINLTKDDILQAFKELDNYDVVISPTYDGGFGLIAMKDRFDIFSDIIYSTPKVLDDIIGRIKFYKKSYKLLNYISDVDTLDDLVSAEFGNNDITLLGAGEYNINFRDKDKVIRINLGSQLNLGEKQIGYEYDALKELESSGATPKPYDLYERGKYIPFGFLTMEYIEGRPLEYYRDFEIAAKLLSKVHSVKIDNSNLIFAEKPFRTMYEEFERMYQVYKDWEDRDREVEQMIDRFMLIAKDSNLDEEIKNPCIINTELNNRNFIIGEDSRIIDWEKPIIGEAEQDLAHFLVPTTTNWKTDVILSKEDMLGFIDIYKRYSDVDLNKFFKYLMFNSLRGITWSAMARVEYSKDRAVKNEDTFNKINSFLKKDFLNMLNKFYEVN